jgi:hypothetical protein
VRRHRDGVDVCFFRRGDNLLRPARAPLVRTALTLDLRLSLFRRYHSA